MHFLLRLANARECARDMQRVVSFGTNRVYELTFNGPSALILACALPLFLPFASCLVDAMRGRVHSVHVACTRAHTQPSSVPPPLYRTPLPPRSFARQNSRGRGARVIRTVRTLVH